MVIWIIGLSGAGKSTLANEVVKKVRCNKKKVVLIDGDIVRETFGNDLGHTLDDRKINADRICQLCKLLDSQDINVVCAILSLFPESRSWNRKYLTNYFEVYIDAPIVDLIKRDPKGIYQKYKDGQMRDVAGMDIEFHKPVNSDLVINNIGTKKNLLEYADFLADKIICE